MQPMDGRGHALTAEFSSANTGPVMAERMPVSQWWADDPTERYWLEITNRPDLGSDVIAPQRDNGGREYWSYSLVTALRPGDVVLHWHKELHDSPAIVGYSRAVAGPFVDELVWEARGTYGRQRASAGPRPAWRYELTGYTAFPTPVGQDAFQSIEERLKEIRAALENRHSGPLYFPFAFSPSRPLRTAQAYLVKFPAAILSALPALEQTPHVELAQRRPSSRTRATNRPSPRSGTGYIADPELRRAIEQHAVRRALEYYKDYEVTDVGSTESYDLHAVRETDELHIEVKGSTGTADTVELTTNEVRHAHTATTDLVVVDQILWERLPDGTIHTSGGRRRRWTTWQPAECDLQPTRYRYRLID